MPNTRGLFSETKYFPIDRIHSPRICPVCESPDIYDQISITQTYAKVEFLVNVCKKHYYRSFKLKDIYTWLLSCFLIFFLFIFNEIVLIWLGLALFLFLGIRFIYLLLSTIYHDSKITKFITLELLDANFRITARCKEWCDQFEELNSDLIIATKELEEGKIIEPTAEMHEKIKLQKKMGILALLGIIIGPFLMLVPIIFNFSNEFLSEMMFNFGMLLIIIGSGFMIALVVVSAQLDTLRKAEINKSIEKIDIVK